MSERDNTVKLITILDYMSLLCLCGLFIEKDNEDVKFHTNQGLILAIIEVCGGIIVSVLSKLPIVGITFSIVGSIFTLLCVALSLCGMYFAAIGIKKPLPIIGSLFNFLK